MRQALDVVAGMIAGHEGPLDAITFNWPLVQQKQAEAFHGKLTESYAATTANKMVSAFRGVMRACRDMGLIAEPQFQAVARLSVLKDGRDKPSRMLTLAELSALFNACAQDHTAAGRRDAALLVVLLSTAMRRTEAIALDLQDYNPLRGELQIRSEVPERNRNMKFGRKSQDAMSDYLNVRGREPGPLLLPVDKGGTIRVRRLTDQAIYGIIQRLSERAGIKPVTARDIRRTRVASLIAKGMALPAVQAAVGHLSWLTTSAYQGFADELKESGGALLPDLPYVKPGQNGVRE